MDAKEFRIRGKEMIDIVADYLENIESRRVIPNVKPGYLKEMIPSKAPQVPDKWEDLVKDIERVIMPGVTHWHNPNFHAFYATANSYPSICADILSDGIGCIGFSWIASPACTELEVVMLDWLAEMLDLPKFFFASSNGLGGGVIQGSSSESTLLTLLSAMKKTIKKEQSLNSELNYHEIKPKLVAYCSEHAHSSVERAYLFADINVRKLPTDEKFSLTGETLRKAVKDDLDSGFIPCYVCATTGTTNLCSFDKLDEIGKICKEYDMWMHIDAAYAGAAFICPEFRYLSKGVELSDSFCFNPNKWLLIHHDCTALWIKNRKYLVESFNVDPIYLKHEQQNVAPDFRHWQIPLGRRFRSLKIWFVLRLYGQEKLQQYIRKHVELAKYFEALVRSDDRFEIVFDVILGLVCFRLKGSNELTEKLLKLITDDGKIFMVPGNANNKYFIRFAICASTTEKTHINYAWNLICEKANLI